MTSEFFPVTHEEWLSRRLNEVSGERGTLTLVELVVLESGREQTVPGIPGVWTYRENDGRPTVTLSEADGVTFDGKPLHGTVQVQLDTPIQFSDTRQVIVNNHGASSFVVNVWDSQASNLLNFDSIDSYPYDPEWVVTARYVPRGPDSSFTVGRANDREAEEVRKAPADITFTRQGKTYTLVAFETFADVLLVVFNDVTTGEETPLSGRFMLVPPLKEEQDITLDFNRTYLPPHACSPLYPCPLAPDDNVLPISVRAGEKQIVFRV